MTQVLEKSLNTGSTFVMQQVGKTNFYNYLSEKFNFGKVTGIEQPNEADGGVAAPAEVNDHTYATISFGQSISTTPIQMISSFAVVANGGKLIQPHLIAEVVSREGDKTVTDSRPLREIISEESAAQLRQMMVSVVKNGHGKQAAVPGYDIAGKTGTAQVPLKDGRGYDPGRNIGSFIGFGPAENARFVVLAKIDSPKGVAWAETTAAPVVGKMLDYLFKYYQIPPTNN
jgi:cell division protein FtsI/penicillin-binding protein 2